MRVNIIGYVRSPVKEQIDRYWGRVISEIHLEKEYKLGLLEIEKVSHLIIVFYMHKAVFDSHKHLIRHPRDNKKLPLTGIFSQRAKNRPNPIGISTVKNLGVQDGILKVQGLDAINSTPVLDIKPYFPHFDYVENPVTPEWADQIMADYFN